MVACQTITLCEIPEDMQTCEQYYALQMSLAICNTYTLGTAKF